MKFGITETALLGVAGFLIGIAITAPATNYAGDANPDWNDQKVCPPGTASMYWGSMRDGSAWKPIYICQSGVQEPYRNETQAPTSTITTPTITTSGVI